VLAALFLPLIGCAPQEPRRPFPAPMRPGSSLAPPPAALPAAPVTARVGLLLPLSGGNAPLGQAMLQAAELALYDQGDRGVAFLPRDTRGTPAGAEAAARAAAEEGARALAGPLTLGETAAGARATGLPVFAFTSDETQASAQVWVLGVTPAQMVRRVMQAMGEQGVRRFGLVAADDAFGQRLAAAMRATASLAGWPAPVIHLAGRGGDVGAAAEAMRAGEAQAVLIGHAGEAARSLAQALAALPSPPRLLGTTLWAAEPGLGNEPALAGALFPGPDPAGRERFDSQYAAAFESRPPRLAGAAYDAAALAARTAREGRPPVGLAFLGADGPVRLLEGGQVQRGLALFALRPGGEPMLVQPAPVPGPAGS
jgi:ABC-type branched-subunit amino acid transport system substrate-binding protein